MIFGLQIIAILFSFAMIYFAFLHFKRGEINFDEIFIWLAIWVFTIFAVVFPNFLKNLSSGFLFARAFDFMVVGAFILVIAMTARAYVSVRKLEKKMEELVRKKALEEENTRKTSKRKK